MKLVISQKNRGAYFEEWVDQANRYYISREIAVIHKIPTSWKVIRNFNPYTKKYEIVSAFPEKKSTVDFGGIASNHSIWFEAKATKNKTSFPLGNIHEHQINYLKSVRKQGGKAFLLIHSEHLSRTWLIWIDQLAEFMATEKRKSITFTWFDKHCLEIPSKNGVILDYLPHVLA